MTGARDSAATPDPQALAAYRESAASLAHSDDPRTVISYREPWGCTHVFLWFWCWFWDVFVAFWLVVAPWFWAGTAMIMLCHLPIGLGVTYWVFRKTWSTLTLDVGPRYVTTRGWPFKPTRTKRDDISEVLVTQRLYDNEGPQAEWLLSTRLRGQLTHALFSCHTGPSESPPAPVDQIATLLAHALACPVIRETLDERTK